jgi:hypothetical protein
MAVIHGACRPSAESQLDLTCSRKMGMSAKVENRVIMPRKMNAWWVSWTIFMKFVLESERSESFKAERSDIHVTLVEM